MIRKAVATTPMTELKDMQTVDAEAERLINEKLLPAVIGEASGPLVMALTFMLVDVARAQQWPEDHLIQFVKDTFRRHASLDATIANAGKA